MNDEFERPDGQFSLEDQAFLKELGISGMSSGLEKALRHFKEAMEALPDIEARADGLQALDLSEETVDRLAKDRGESSSEIRENLSFFRDVEKKKKT